MGDRCYMEIWVHNKWRDVEKEHGRLYYITDDGSTPNESTMEFDLFKLYEVNYGGAYLTEQLDKYGVKYFGWHDAGGDYPAARFFNTQDGRGRRVIATNADGFPIVTYGASGDLSPKLEPLDEFLEDHKAFVRVSIGDYPWLKDSPDE